MITELLTPTGIKILIVENLPEQLTNIEINGNILSISYDKADIDEVLPTGKWSILGRLNSLTEEQIMSIMPEIPNYEKMATKQYLYQFTYFLQSQNINVNLNPLFLKSETK